jgi:DNA-directed RNA polymerase specialized sigma24 family protein
LALILTGDELRAEECLLAAFDSCVDGRLVFKESAASWSKRSVIKTGIKLMLPLPSVPLPSDPSKPHFHGNDSNMDSDQEASLKYVLELPAFDRFVFVMSVLEGCSDRDCALLLGCSCADLVAARIRAFQQISRRVTEMYPGYRRGA